jgi:hypothetical protein
MAKDTIPVAPGLTGRQDGMDLVLPMFSKAVAERLIAKEVRDGLGLARGEAEATSVGALRVTSEAGGPRSRPHQLINLQVPTFSPFP